MCIRDRTVNRVLSNSISVFDTKARKEEKESSYHNLLVGILTGNDDWLVKSNAEAGEGFADIIVETDDPDAGIIAELKYTKDFKEMETACSKALEQIKEDVYKRQEWERSGMGFAFMEAFMDEMRVESEVSKGTKIYMKKKVGAK